MTSFLSYLADRDNLQIATVHGPLSIWRADVEIAILNIPSDNAALRTFFVNNLDPLENILGDTRKFNLPNTLLVLCSIHSVSVDIGVTSIKIDTEQNREFRTIYQDIEQIENALDSGQATVLLVQAEPKEWKKDKPEFTCVAGKIDVGKLIDLSADSELSRTISQLGFDKEKDQLHLHASGCSIHGQVSLPWQGPDESITGSFLLTPLLPNEEKKMHCRLRLDQEMLTEEEHDEIGTAWENLSKKFRHDSEFKSDKADKPTWVTLEAKQDAIPDMYWPSVDVNQQEIELGSLHIAPEAFRLILSDQHPDDPNNSPDTLAYVQPEVVRIEKKEGVVSIVIESGERPTVFDEGTETEEEQHPPLLSFVGNKAEEEKEWKNTFTLSNMNFAFDHVRTARQIRMDQDLPVPRWNPADKPENTEPLESPSITGFMPIEDGWAQVPIPNLTEQIYTDAGLIQPEISLKKSDSMLLQGAVMYGNEEVFETKQQGVSPNPCSLLLTNARYIKGEWHLRADSLALSSVDLTIFKPDITLDGFLWLSAGRPTTANALPDFDNWVSGLYSVPLRTVHTGLPFTIPYIEKKVDDIELDGIKIVSEIEKYLEEIANHSGQNHSPQPIELIQLKEKLFNLLRRQRIFLPEDIKPDKIEVARGGDHQWQINAKIPVDQVHKIKPLYTVVIKPDLNLLTVYHSLGYLLFDDSVTSEGLPLIARKIREKKEAEVTLLSIFDNATVDKRGAGGNEDRETAKKELIDFFQDSERNIFLPEKIQPNEIEVKEISVPDENESEKRIKRRWQININLPSTYLYNPVQVYTVIMLESEFECDFTVYHSLGYLLRYEFDKKDAEVNERFGSDAIDYKMPDAKERIIELFALNDIDLSKELTGYHPEQQGDANEFQLIDRANGFTCTIREESGVLKIRKNDAEIFPPLFTFHVDELTLSRKVPGVKENERSYGELGQWSFSYKRSQRVFARLEKENLLAPQAGYSSSLWNPLFWLCHPSLPMIQALPLTQNQTPPNYPSPSRQLVPFEIDLENKEEVFESWSFGADDNGQWPTVYGNFLKPAEIWKEHFDLPIVSLSLPGLLYDPRRGVQLSNEGSGTHPVEKLLVQYRYDLPYTDELNALASLPETPTDSAARQNDDTAEAVEELQPLTPGTFFTYWQQLSTQASLAAVDAVEAMKPNDSSSFYHLIEPYSWPVSFKPDLGKYPGNLQLEQDDGNSLTLERENLLKGISGNFQPGSNNTIALWADSTSSTANPFEIEAGSMAAHGDSNEVRDQRGLRRSVTKELPEGSGSNLLQTSVTLTELSGEKQYKLSSLKVPISLEVHKDNNWHFWFKDLPVKEGEFSRINEKDNKTFLEINHRDGLSREQNYLLGYEWRLGYEKKEDIVPLKLFKLDFYPLVLQRVKVNATGEISLIEIRGRLQLPLTDPKELDYLNNLVVLTFTVEENDSIQPVKQIKLTDIKNVGSGEWPLQDEEKNTSNARLIWGGISLGNGELLITDLQLRHSLFNVEWTHQLHDLILQSDPSSDSPSSLEEVPSTDDHDPSVRITTSLKQVQLDFAKPENNSALLAVIIGRDDLYIVQEDDSLLEIADKIYKDASKSTVIYHANIGRIIDKDRIKTGWVLRIPDLGDPGDAATRSTFQAGVVFDLFTGQLAKEKREPRQGGEPVKEEEPKVFCNLFGKLNLSLTQKDVFVSESTLQFQWDKCLHPSPSLQFLPGMSLKPVNAGSSDVPQEYNAPGIAVITFKPIKEGTQDNKPRLQLQTGYIETLLTCTWGEDNFLQEVQKTKERKEADATEEADPSGINVNSLQVFSSSSGNITCGYTAQFSLKKKQKPNEAQWVESFLLNGILEVKNLVSWPQDLGYSDGNKNNLKLPLVTEKIEHLRHTIRVLLNQHELPKDMLNGGTSDSLLFSFGTEKAWQFLAAVEHQLVNIKKSEAAHDEWLVNNDQRWTVVQEVRLAHPEKLKKFLEVNSKYTVDPRKGINTIGAVGHGYVNDSVDEELTKALDDVIKAEQESAGHSMLLVEAGAHHWLKQQAVTAAELSTLQFLPNGSQQAVLSSPADYTVSFKKQNETEKTAWELLSIPFFGRVQDGARDGVPEEDAGAVDDKRDMDLLRVDPIWHIHSKYRNDEKLPSLLSMFTHFVKHDVELELSAFDTLNTRVFQRLDPASLEENWFRLHHPASEKEAAFQISTSNESSSEEDERLMSHAMAALHDTPARLSRAAALNQLFDTRRSSYPPTAGESDHSTDHNELSDDLVWRQKSILLYPGVIDSRNPEHHKYHGWLIAGLQLQESRVQRFSDSDETGNDVAVYPAATLLPGYAENDNPMPVSYAVSPYLQFSFISIPKKNGAEEKPQVIVAELICLDAANRLSPVANRIWDLTEVDPDIDPDTGKDINIETVKRQSQFWAEALHLRLAPDSPIAFLRFREIHKVESSSNGVEKQPLLVTRYSYAYVEGLKLPEKLMKTGQPLRFEVEQLQFRDGQFGGQKMPTNVRDFELAPPQVTGVQPLYIQPEDKGFADLPWGYSALRITTQYTQYAQYIDEEGKPHSFHPEGVIGAPIEKSVAKEYHDLWWHAPQHLVQFRTSSYGKNDNGKSPPTAGLPEKFRAKAIKSFLPVIAQPVLPQQPLKESEEELEDHSKDSPVVWQPVLPGDLRYLLVGNRAGSMLAFRDQILRQTLVQSADNQFVHDQTLVSGSIPVQHRVPRPVPLPPNQESKDSIALQTWASFFEPTENALVSNTPADEAFFAPCEVQFKVTDDTVNALLATGIKQVNRALITEKPLTTVEEFLAEIKKIIDPDEVTRRRKTVALKYALRIYGVGPARRLRMKLTSPVHAEIPIDWDGILSFECTCDPSELNKWRKDVSLLINGTSFFLSKEEPSENTKLISFKVEEKEALSTQLTLAKPGAIIMAEAIVSPPENKEGFSQTLSFMLRRAGGQRSLPLTPWFIYFEDPEYNRRLASPTARVVENILEAVKVTDSDGNEKDMKISHAVTLSADRKEYNPDSVVTLCYDWDDERNDTLGSLTFQRIVGGVPEALDMGAAIENVNSEEIAPGKVIQVSLSKLPAQKHLVSGDTLQLTFDIPKKKENDVVVRPKIKMTLQVNIITEPVIPRPEAAYALLRHQKNGEKQQVQCVRFAWGPEASRVELVCPKDLRTEIVRRRAVFQWQDSARQGTVTDYKVQKITENGSTHFPVLPSPD